MNSSFTPRFHKGVYRDCKWCRGKGCLSCSVEADKEYKRQFPDGPKPIATFERTPEGLAGLSVFIQEMFGGDRDAEGAEE